MVLQQCRLRGTYILMLETYMLNVNVKSSVIGKLFERARGDRVELEGSVQLQLSHCLCGGYLGAKNLTQRITACQQYSIV